MNTTSTKRKQSNFISEIGLFFYIIFVNVKVRLSYTIDFWLEMLIFGIEQCVGLLMVTVIFSKVHAIGGWTLMEMVFLYGFYMLSMFGYRLFIQGVFFLPFLIESGDFDQVLTKPRSALTLIFSQHSNLHGLGNLIIGMALVIIASINLEFSWNPKIILVFTFYIFCANAVTVSLKLMASTLAFYITRVDSFNMLLMQLQNFCRYPISIYPAALRIILSTVIPLAFTAFFPVKVLLNIGNDITAFTYILTPLATVIFMIVSYLFFKISVRNYQSTGY